MESDIFLDEFNLFRQQKLILNRMRLKLREFCVQT